MTESLNSINVPEKMLTISTDVYSILKQAKRGFPCMYQALVLNKHKLHSR